MSKIVMSGIIDFHRLPDKPSEKLYDELAWVIADAIDKYNSEQKRGWASGFVTIRTKGDAPFGETAVCDECGAHYLLDDTDFKEVGNKLLCSVCQNSDVSPTSPDTANRENKWRWNHEGNI